MEDDATYQQSRFDGEDRSNQVARRCTFDQVIFSKISLASTSLTEAKFTDVMFERTDLAGAVWHDVSLLRVRLVGCRLSAFALNRCRLVDVEMSDCRGDCASVFESDGRRWLVEDCDLPEFDARGLRLTDARFERSCLPESQWGHAKLERVAFVRSELGQVGGTGGLSGAQVDTPTLLSLAPALAHHTGISVSDET